MTKPFGPLLALILASIPLVSRAGAAEVRPIAVDSPDGRIRATFRLGEGGRPGFEVAFRGRVVAAGTLGLEFAEGGRIEGGLKVEDTFRRSIDESYSIAVGKASTARDRHNEVIVTLTDESGHRRLAAEFRAFDDGVAFRQVASGRGAESSYVLKDELTRLNFPEDPATRALPMKNYTTSYENYYRSAPVSGLKAGRVDRAPGVAGPGRRGPERGARPLGGRHRGQPDRLRRDVPGAGRGPAGDARRQALAAAGTVGRRQGGRPGPARVPLAGPDDRRRPGTADRVEPGVPPQRPVADRRPVVDQAGQDDLPLVERVCPGGGGLQARREHGDDEALHRLLRRQRDPLPLARRPRHRLVRRADPAQRQDRHHQGRPVDRHARTPPVRQGEERPPPRLAPLAGPEAADRRGVPGLRAVGARRGDGRLHGPRRPGDGRASTTRWPARPPSTT